LLKGFLRDFADTPQRLTEYLGTHDTGKIAALAHSVKGSAGYFSTRDFYEFADRLERAARDGGAAGLEDLVMEFYYRMERFLRDVDGGVDALRELDARVGAPVDRDAVLAMIDRAAALVGRGEYAASQLLEQIRDALQGRTEQELAIAAQAHFDELELEAAGAALSQLSETLGAACRTTRL
jgi:HPt (histidine-containing phosphotransfer) domain-containing protein